MLIQHQEHLHPMMKEQLWTQEVRLLTKMKIQDKFQFFFCKILKYKEDHVKVLLERFRLSGHTIGFHLRSQKLEPLKMSP